MHSDLITHLKKRVNNLDIYVALLVLNPKNYHPTRIGLLKYLISSEKMPGIYITLNKPSEIIIKELDKTKVDTRLIIFIDGMTRTINNSPAKINNCLFINSPEKLSDLFVAIDQAINSITYTNKFIILDSINTLALFNNNVTVARFVHQLTAKIHFWKIKGIFVTMEKSLNPGLLSELTQFCDILLDNNKG